MIFRRSLSKRKGAAYSFFSGMASSFVPAAGIFIMLTLLMAVLPAIIFIDRNYSAAESMVNLPDARETYRFILFGGEDFLDTTLINIVLAVLGILAVFTAVRIFSFICDKRTVNVFYSLGIKRMTLFLSKYFSGALLLCGACLVASALSFAVNLIFLRLSFQLVLAAIHLYCGLSVFLLVCYSVTAAVFSSVGTVSEAVIYSAAVLFAPTLIAYIIECIISSFIPSNTYYEYIMHFASGDSYRNASASLMEATASYNPLLFFGEELLKYGEGKISDSGTVLSGIDASWKFPNVFMHFRWFVVGGVLSVVGALSFRRIRAENCGFLNTNKLLSNLTLFELLFAASCICLSEINWNGLAFCLIVGGIAAFVVYIIAEIYLKRNFKKIITSLYKFVIHALVIAVIFSVCIFDVFGYASYIPKREKIQSAEIAIPFSYSEISLNSHGLGQDSDGTFVYRTSYWFRYMPVMTSEKDIDTVLKINEQVLSEDGDDGNYCEIIIRYNLENGKCSERKHILTTKEEITLLFELFDSDAYKAELHKLFYEENRLEKIKQEASEYTYIDESELKTLCFEYEYSEVIARSPDLMTNSVLKLTKEQFTALKDAVYQDMLQQNAYEYFTGDMKQLGVISFAPSDAIYTIEGVNGYTEIPTEPVTEEPTLGGDGNYSEDVTDTWDDGNYSEDVTDIWVDGEYYEDAVEEYTEVNPDKNGDGNNGISDSTEYFVTMPYDPYAEDEEIIILPEKENSPYEYRYEQMYNGLDNSEYDSTYDIIITEAMTNTLAFLEKEGFSDCFTSELKPVSIGIRRYNPLKTFDYYSWKENYCNDFFSYPMSNEGYYGGDIDLDCCENVITDEAMLRELDEKMKLHAYAYTEGYMCLIKYSGNKYSVRYIAEDDAPDYVKNFTYNYY